MKQTILMVHNYYQIPGGEDTVVANEKKLLEKNGHKVVLYTRNNSELKNMGFFRKLLLPLTTIYNPRTVRDIKKIIKEEQIDIVHIHNTLNLVSPAAYYAATKMKKPVVQTIHNFRLLCPGATFYREGHICEDCVNKGLVCSIVHKCYRSSFFQTLICAISTKIHRTTGIYGKINYICLTEFNREKLLQLKEINESKVFVKPNFVNKTVRPKKYRKEQFVFAGRLDKLKGVDKLLEVWKELGVSAPKLVLCGTGPIEDWCIEYVKKNRLNVEIKGFIPNAETLEIIGESKALILPTQWYEGFPMTIVEAYSVGTPVICPDIGNVGSVVIEGCSGWKYSDIKDIPEALNKALSSDKYDTVIKMYEDNYSEIQNYNLLLGVYNKLLLK